MQTRDEIDERQVKHVERVGASHGPEMRDSEHHSAIPYLSTMWL